ncbi:MAG: hypothetical protein HY362_03825 [Candidatus Aenigmarchaeota archaeon]|nr:hypothetical protein [Candidatus Aenigmarchaeota archaeon]
MINDDPRAAGAEKDIKAAQSLYTHITSKFGLPEVEGLSDKAYRQFADIISHYRTADPIGTQETRNNLERDATTWFLREYAAALREEADVLKNSRYGVKAREDEIKAAQNHLRSVERDLRAREENLTGREVRYDSQMSELQEHIRFNTETSARMKEKDNELAGEKAQIDEERARIDKEKEELKQAKETFESTSRALEAKRTDIDASSKELGQRWVQYRELEDSLKERDDKLRTEETAYQDREKERQLGTAALAAELDMVSRKEKDIEQQRLALEKEKAGLKAVEDENSVKYKAIADALNLREARIVDQEGDMQRRREVLEAAMKTAEERAAAAERVKAEADKIVQQAQAAPSDRETLLIGVEELRKRAEAAENDATVKQGMLDEVGRDVAGLRLTLDQARRDVDEARKAGELTDATVVAYIQKRAELLKPGSLPIGKFFRGKTKVQGGKGAADSFTYILPDKAEDKPIEVTSTPVDDEKKE